MQQPITFDAAAASFWRSELPLFGRLDRLLGKVLAARRRVQLGRIHATSGVDVDTHSDPNSPVNRPAGFVGDFGQYLVHHVALRCRSVSVAF